MTEHNNDLRDKGRHLHRLFKQAGDVIEDLTHHGVRTHLEVVHNSGEGLLLHDLNGEFLVDCQLCESMNPVVTE